MTRKPFDSILLAAAVAVPAAAGVASGPVALWVTAAGAVLLAMASAAEAWRAARPQADPPVTFAGALGSPYLLLSVLATVCLAHAVPAWLLAAAVARVIFAGSERTLSAGATPSPAIGLAALIALEAVFAVLLGAWAADMALGGRFGLTGIPPWAIAAAGTGVYTLLSGVVFGRIDALTAEAAPPRPAPPGTPVQP